MRSRFALLLPTLMLVSISSGCPGPVDLNPLVDHRAVSYDDAPSRRETTRWEPTPTEVAVRPPAGRATLQGPPSPVFQSSGTNDPWARNSLGNATSSETTAMGVNGRTGWIQ